MARAVEFFVSVCHKGSGAFAYLYFFPFFSFLLLTLSILSVVWSLSNLLALLFWFYTSHIPLVNTDKHQSLLFFFFSRTTREPRIRFFCVFLLFVCYEWGLNCLIMFFLSCLFGFGLVFSFFPLLRFFLLFFVFGETVRKGGRVTLHVQLSQLAWKAREKKWAHTHLIYHYCCKSIFMSVREEVLVGYIRVRPRTTTTIVTSPPFERGGAKGVGS